MVKTNYIPPLSDYQNGVVGLKDNKKSLYSISDDLPSVEEILDTASKDDDTSKKFLNLAVTAKEAADRMPKRPKKVDTTLSDLSSDVGNIMANSGKDIDTLSNISDNVQTSSTQPAKNVSREALERAVPEDSESKSDWAVDYGLPLLGVLEAISSQGQSPGTTALNAQKLIREQKAYDIEQKGKQEERKQKALSKRMKESYLKEVQSLNPESPTYNKDILKIAMKYEEDPTKILDYSAKLKPGVTPLTPEEMQDLKTTFPDINDSTFVNDPAGWRRVLQSRGKGNKPQISPATDAEIAEWQKKFPGVSPEAMKANPEKYRGGMIQYTTSEARTGGFPTISPDQKIIFEQENKLRDDFSAKTKDFNTIRDAYNRIQAAAESPTAAGDLSLIFQYMKILDPTSTVREGEFANAQNAAGVPDRIVAQYNNIIKGTRLSPDQRADFLGRSKDLYKAQALTYNKNVDYYEGLAKSYGVNPSRVVTPRVVFEEQPKTNTQPQASENLPVYTPEQAKSLPAGTKFKGTNGKIYTK